MGEVDRPRLYLTLRSFLVPQCQDADGFVVVVPAEHVFDKRDVEVEFAGLMGSYA